MSVYINNLANEADIDFYNYTREITEEADRLKKETPNEATKDNKKLCANLKTQKRKLLSDTLKELREMGLRLQSTADVQKMLTSVTAVIATSKTLSGTIVAGSDGYFFKILDLLPRLRASVSECNEEVPPADVQKGLAAAENLLFTLIAGRENLSKTAELSEKIENFVSVFSESSLEKLSSSAGLVKATQRDATHASLAQAQKLKYWLPRIINVALESLQSASHFTRVAQYSTSVYEEAKSFVNTLHVSNSTVLLESDVQVVLSIKSFLSTFSSKLNEWKNTNVEVAFVADFILDWISTQQFTFDVSSSTSLTKITTVEDVELAFRQLMTSTIISVQKIAMFQKESSAVSNEEQNWLIDAQTKLSRYSKLLYPLSMASKFESCIELLNSVEYNENTMKQVQALVSYTLPIVKHFQNLVNTVLTRLRDNYIDISHGTYNLSFLLYKIAKDGFCSPQPPQESKEDDNLHEGTGLGDGEGATNNSKDVEDDEDLSEQAQQPNEENKDKDQDQEENDDAVDIEGDMAGDLEDAPPEDDEGEDEDKDQEDEELDEEIDNLDDLDPNAMDDKMWDEEASEDSKEKDSDKMPEDSKANDDMEGVDEDQEDDGKQDKNKENPQEDDSKPPEESKDEG
ncbi:unnamed protein product [Ambrosiozyma monospora]|uniref:Unnamed protein product n=1 Tax=Ambrosiozyma monospora TaxID=43982 RepID=A0ACB5T946_AMBMO|nr:unnamed protein product [Ambrosiozyma monospora]